MSPLCGGAAWFAARSLGGDNPILFGIRHDSLVAIIFVDAVSGAVRHYLDGKPGESPASLRAKFLDYLNKCRIVAREVALVESGLVIAFVRRLPLLHAGGMDASPSR